MVTEVDVTAACYEFLSRAVDLGRALCFGGTLPMSVRQVTWLSPSPNGGSRGGEHRVESIDFTEFWRLCGDGIEATDEWRNLKIVAEEYEREIGTPPTAALPGLRLSYPTNALNEYLLRAGGLEFSSEVADSVGRDLVAYCQSKTARVVGLQALSNFSAPNAFNLAPHIRIRPISPEELVRFGTTDFRFNLRIASEQWKLVPSTAWWVCEAYVDLPKEALLNFHSVSRVLDLIPLALRILRGGAFQVIPLETSQEPPFNVGMTSSSGITREYSVRGDPMELSEEDVIRLREFWPKLSSVFNRESHYLELAARRLEFGGQRNRLEDALVDYVVGLESLLGHGGGEVSYRVSMRGAAVLSRGGSERFDKFKELRNLYDLRSKIVHGAQPDRARLTTSTAAAESALRGVWHWYFENWTSEKSTKKPIERIDQLLFSPGGAANE